MEGNIVNLSRSVSSVKGSFNGKFLKSLGFVVDDLLMGDSRW